MPTRDVVLFVDEAPEFRYEKGLFRVVFETDGAKIERVMRPSIFFLALRRAAEAARQHRQGGAAIIPFERTEEDAATGH